MPRPLVRGELHSYQDWQREGYQVQRGEVHCARDANGVALFNDQQVRPRTRNTYAAQQPGRRSRVRESQPPQIAVDHDDVVPDWWGAWGDVVDNTTTNRPTWMSATSTTTSYAPSNTYFIDPQSNREYHVDSQGQIYEVKRGKTRELQELTNAVLETNHKEWEARQRLALLQNKLAAMEAKRTYVPPGEGVHQGLARLSEIEQRIIARRP